MKTQFFISLLIFLSICSCSKNNNSNSTIQISNKVEGILHGKIHTIEHFFYKPYRIFHIQNKLIVYDEIENDIFKVFKTIPKIEHIFSFGKNGKGPNEFQFINSRNMIAHDSVIEVLDFNNYKTFYVQDTGFDLKNSIDLSFSTDQVINNIIRINQNDYIIDNFTGSHYPNKEFKYISTIDQSSRYIGAFPLLNKKFDTYRKKKSKTLSYCISNSNPDKDKIMAFYARLNIIKLMNSKGETLKEFRLSNSNKQDNIYLDESYLTHSIPCQTQRFIYVLFYNCKNTDIATVTPELHIWDWNGKLLKQLKLDQSIYTLAVTSDNKTLYGINFEGGQKIVEFQLPRLE